jgi:hypothetical protein
MAEATSSSLVGSTIMKWRFAGKTWETRDDLEHAPEPMCGNRAATWLHPGFRGRAFAAAWGPTISRPTTGESTICVPARLRSPCRFARKQRAHSLAEVFILPYDLLCPCRPCYSTSEDRIQDIEGHQLGRFQEASFLESRMLPPPYLRYVISVDPRRGGPSGDAAVAAFDRAMVFKRNHPVAYHSPPPT